MDRLPFEIKTQILSLISDPHDLLALSSTTRALYAIFKQYKLEYLSNWFNSLPEDDIPYLSTVASAPTWSPGAIDVAERLNFIQKLYAETRTTPPPDPLTIEFLNKAVRAYTYAQRFQSVIDRYYNWLAYYSLEHQPTWHIRASFEQWKGPPPLPESWHLLSYPCLLRAKVTSEWSMNPEEKVQLWPKVDGLEGALSLICRAWVTITLFKEKFRFLQVFRDVGSKKDPFTEITDLCTLGWLWNSYAEPEYESGEALDLAREMSEIMWEFARGSRKEEAKKAELMRFGARRP